MYRINAYTLSSIMGCDYYIDQFLKIEHTKGICYVELPTIRGYYPDMDWGVYDNREDIVPYYETDTYKTLNRQVIEFVLTPRPDIIIYSDKQFKTQHFKEKYAPLIAAKVGKRTTGTVKYPDIFVLHL